jgi:type II secretory pathway pseudopilin PulG
VILAVVLGIIALFLVLGGILLLLNYRKSREKKLAARQSALLATQGAASKVTPRGDKLQMVDI